MAQRIIDLDDLPAPIARGFEVVAEMAWVLAGKPSQRAPSRQSTTLATRKGVVYGSLRREEIYDEYLTQQNLLPCLIRMSWSMRSMKTWKNIPPRSSPNARGILRHYH